MITRLLPAAEWDRLEITGSAGMDLDPAHSVVIVVEDEGEIVGVWAVMEQIHVEGLWIAPTHQKRASVFRRLLGEMRVVVSGFFGRHVALTAALDDGVAAMVQAYGGVKLPGEHYVFPVAGVN